MNTRDELRQWALHLAEHGWPVFPLRPNSKVPALHGADRCPGTAACSNGHAGWEHRATTNTTIVDRCWSHDAYNIGVATGPARLVGIDLDVAKHGAVLPDGWNMLGVCSGADVLAHLADRAGQPLPQTYTVRTVSGGWHLYFCAPRGIEFRNTQGTQGGLGPMIDTRAHGGYLVGPGSLVPPGGYELYDDHPPADLPGWLAQPLTPTPRESLSAPREIASAHRSRYLRSALDREAQRVTAALPGARNKALFLASCALGQLVAGGALTEADVRAALEHASHTHVETGAYSDHQRHNTITYGLKAGSSRPRTLDQGDSAA